jgi:FkbM family methyltransferase
MRAVNPTLIFDIGACEGNDTSYYLRKGFQVVALEADPLMHEHLRRRFAQEIADGSVIVLNMVASDASGSVVQFWRNELYQALSSADFDKAQFREHLVPHSVPSANWRDLIRLRGIPHYCKVDIEGGESRFLRSMLGSDAYPAFISAECHTFEPIEVLSELGYHHFKFVNQTMLSPLISTIPNPPLEGNYVPDPDWSGASGPFGRELPDHWLTFDEATEIFGMIMRLKTFRAILAPYWFDCHAAREVG